MTITKMCIRIKLNVVITVAAVLSVLVLFFDVASVSAFKGYEGPSGPIWAFNGNTRPGSGKPSSPPADRRGEGYFRGDPGLRNHGSGPRPGYYRGDRSQGNYSNDHDPRFYRGQPFSPYGGLQRGGYGERKSVQSRGDAQRMLNDYYMRRSMRIGPIREDRFYYEADILDRNNRFMDRVIIDKRSGRIRSIY